MNAVKAGCRTTKSRRLRSNSAKPSSATGLPVGLHWCIKSVHSTHEKVTDLPMDVRPTELISGHRNVISRFFPKALATF